MSEHGTSNAYSSGCRCAACREAMTRYMRELAWARMERRELVDGRLTAPLPAERHGTQGTYNNHGCRCAVCTEAHSARHRAWRKARS